MDNPEKVVNLKESNFLIGQYVELRNHYCERLLTLPVSIDETRAWLKGSKVEVFGIVREEILLGAAILYIRREGEIAFFTKTPGQGVGGRLLSIMEEVARQRKLKSVWAWVLDENIAAQKTFLKNGYIPVEKSNRQFMGEKSTGVVFRKRVSTI